jgi:pentatricopeptide repeat protein
MACEANGFIGAARQAYETSVALAPDEPRSWYRLALVRSRLGDVEGAMASLARALELAPDYAPAWSRRGQWLLDRGDIGRAETAFERAAAIDRDDRSAQTGLARVRLERRDDAGAVRVLEDLLERQPGDRYALLLLGTAYRRLGRGDEAEFALAVGASGEPSVKDPWSEEIAQYRRGFATMLKAATQEALAGRFDRAIPLLEELRQRKPHDVALGNHLADVLVAAGRHEEAVRLLTDMLERGAANADSHLALASAYVAARDAARAEAHADRAIALGAAGARANEIKGLIAWRTGRTSDAVHLLEEGYGRDPRNVKLLAWIGMIRLEQGRPRDAIDAFSDGLRRNPMHAETLAGLALAQLALGEREEAALALARAEQVAPDHPRVREAKARLAGDSRGRP